MNTIYVVLYSIFVANSRDEIKIRPIKIITDPSINI